MPETTSRRGRPPRRPAGDRSRDRLQGHVCQDGGAPEPSYLGDGRIRLVDLDIALHPVRRDVLSSREQRHGVIVKRHDRRPPQFRRGDGQDARAGANVDKGPRPAMKAAWDPTACPAAEPAAQRVPS